ncbi:hypothetical protein NG825_20925 [Xanthomonas sacchari]|nr:hypothetical protein NG825_20925 [Xanthomonas sacchari]
MSLDAGSRGDVALMRIKAIIMLPSTHRKLAAMYCLFAWVMVCLQTHATAIAFLSVALLHLVSARRLALCAGHRSASPGIGERSARRIGVPYCGGAANSRALR